MKRTLALLALLAPAVASAQIYPLEVYANAMRANSKQQFKFMHSPRNGVYVGLCTPRAEGDYFCDLAKDGTYKTADGVTFSTKHMGQLFSADGSQRCEYKNNTLECE